MLSLLVTPSSNDSNTIPAEVGDVALNEVSSRGYNLYQNKIWEMLNELLKVLYRKATGDMYAVTISWNGCDCFAVRVPLPNALTGSFWCQDNVSLFFNVLLLLFAVTTTTTLITPALGNRRKEVFAFFWIFGI